MKRIACFFFATFVVLSVSTACNQKGSCVMDSGSLGISCSEEIPKSTCESGKGQTFHPGKLCVTLGYTKPSGGAWVKP